MDADNKAPTQLAAPPQRTRWSSPCSRGAAMTQWKQTVGGDPSNADLSVQAKTLTSSTPMTLHCLGGGNSNSEDLHTAGQKCHQFLCKTGRPTTLAPHVHWDCVSARAARTLGSANEGRWKEQHATEIELHWRLWWGAGYGGLAKRASTIRCVQTWRVSG
jgi:hypothetical protein